MFYYLSIHSFLKTKIQIIKFFRHQEEKKFHCEHCDVKMSVRANLLKHIDTVHLNIKRFRCDLCPKAFSIKTAMETHRR